MPFDLHKDFTQGSWGDLPWLRRNCNIILEPHLTSDYTDVETMQPRNGEPEGMEGVLRDQLTGIPMSGTFPPSRLALVQTVRRLEGDLRTAGAARGRNRGCNRGRGCAQTHVRAPARTARAPSTHARPRRFQR